jgi:hypothetical protein
MCYDSFSDILLVQLLTPILSNCSCLWLVFGQILRIFSFQVGLSLTDVMRIVGQSRGANGVIFHVTHIMAEYHQRGFIKFIDFLYAPFSQEGGMVTWMALLPKRSIILMKRMMLERFMWKVRLSSISRKETSVLLDLLVPER